MPEAEVVYSDVKFTRTMGNTIVMASSSADTTYSEVRILKTQPSTSLLGGITKQEGSQQVVSNGGSKVKSEKVALVILLALLAVVVIALCYVSYDNMQTKKSLQTLKAEHEAKRKNFSEILSENMVPPSCPQSPEIKRDDSCLKCDKGWEQHRGKCYFFSTLYLSWEKSRRFCQNKGGDLVKIDSRVEQIFLVSELTDKMGYAEDKFWIGLTDSKEENKWFWVDNSPLNTSLSFWSKTEPDNWNGENDNGEDCVRMGEKAGAKELKCWFDKSCNRLHRSICEKQAQTGLRRVTCF